MQNKNETGEFKRVVGLQYEKGNGLPRVILKGQGLVAEEILQMRNQGKAPHVVKDEKLVKELFKLPIDGEINRELFEIVALLLVHVFALDKKMENQKS